MVTIGIVGEADVQGVLPGGRAVAVECKSGNDVLRRRQKAWRDRFEELGGLYVLAHNEKGIEDLRRTLTQNGFWS